MGSQLAYGDIPSFLEKNCVIKSTASEVLKILGENYKKFGKVTDQDLLLSTIFGETLKKALEIIEDNKITYYHTPSNIGIYQVFKMNEREDWNNRNTVVEQFVYPGVQPSFGVSSHNWAHVPPRTMPWGLPPESHPSIVRFTAGDFNLNPLPVKRKYDSGSDMPPAKMLVTEEKMAAHMRGLHISDVEPSEVPSIKEEPMETERLPRLVISDEIKNMKTESLIPESILKKLEKPEMALVLWQPPAVDLGTKLRELRKLSVMKNKEKQKEKKENKEDKEMEVEEEEVTDEENKTSDSIFKPINPVSTPQYFQPVPQVHGYSLFS